MPSLLPFIDEVISAQTSLKKTAQAFKLIYIKCLFVKTITFWCQVDDVLVKRTP